MSNQFQTKLQEPQNLRKIFHDLQEKLKSSPKSSSLQKKLSPFKRILDQVKKCHSPNKNLRFTVLDKNNSKQLKESTESSENMVEQKIWEDKEFIQLYNSDPIFRCRIQRLFNEQMKKASKSSMKITKRATWDCAEIEQQTSMRTTFKNHRSENQRVLLHKIQSYKKILKRQNSNQTSPSSEDNQ